MRIKITLLLLIGISVNVFSQIQENAVTLKTKTGEIKGTLLCPSLKTNTPLVLLIAGSGPTDRNGNNPIMVNNALKLLAEGLFQNGIASLRYDKRGIAESKHAGVNESDLRFENYIEDAISWVDFLKTDSRFSEIIIAGHSEGSLVGMIAAQKDDVVKFISIAGVGTPAGNILKEQLKAQPSIVLNQSLSIIEKLEKGETTNDVPQMLYSLFRPSVQPYLISWFKYNPQEEIAKLDKPILIIQGTTDIQVSVSDADKLMLANSQCKKEIIQGMNHVLKASELDRQKNIETYSNPDLPLKSELVQVITRFVK